MFKVIFVVIQVIQCLVEQKLACLCQIGSIMFFGDVMHSVLALCQRPEQARQQCSLSCLVVVESSMCSN